MRSSRVMVGLLVLSLVVGMIGLAGIAKPGKPLPLGPRPLPPEMSNSVTDMVSWTVQGFIELTIDDSAFDFGLIDAGVDSVTVEEANTLAVVSNTEWTLSYTITGTGSDHLGVLLSDEAGEGNAEINVGYSLNDLRSMDPGSYTATVTYTVAAK
ncbi:hypothetical protein J7J63_02060 [Candidatus Bipolaricaulota bacterium]|nr:hypothetical protein [Candidatus Bipolaricaulota bacterium]